jgi:putative ABC transport system permease protein
MPYSLAMLWYQRRRFLPAILAVAFSAVLIAVQCGLLLGVFSLFSMPVDRGRADIWVGYSGVRSVDLSLPIPAAWKSRLELQPEVERVEPYVCGSALWGTRDGVESCSVLGTRLDDGALGPVRELTPDLRARLAEPNTIVVDESELTALGLRGVGDVGEVSGRRVRVVGLVRGLRGVAGPYLFCSTATARHLLGLGPDQTTFLLARCRHPGDAPAVVGRLRSYEAMSACTSAEFSLRSRLHWLTKTKAGIALGCAALLGLIVATAVTTQTLNAATAAALREYAVLEALGIPTWRMGALVLTQSFWVGLFGIGLAVPASIGSAQVVRALGGMILLPAGLLGSAAALTLLTALLSGLLSLRSLRFIQPAALLR